jgi:hypothetical protein
MQKVIVSTLKIGDVIMPPAREVSLWMRRHCQEQGLSESALHLTITEIKEGSSDKKGAWLIIKADHNDEWCGNSKLRNFSFKARPDSSWLKV